MMKITMMVLSSINRRPSAPRLCIHSLQCEGQQESTLLRIGDAYNMTAQVKDYDSISVLWTEAFAASVNAAFQAAGCWATSSLIAISITLVHAEVHEHVSVTKRKRKRWERINGITFNVFFHFSTQTPVLPSKPRIVRSPSLSNTTPIPIPNCFSSAIKGYLILQKEREQKRTNHCKKEKHGHDVREILVPAEPTNHPNRPSTH